MENKNIDNIRDKNPYFFDSIFYSLENSLFADLAVLFSKSSSNQISFDKILNLLDKKKIIFIEEKINKNKNVKNKLFEWRNKNKGGHKDLKVSINPEKFEKDYSLKFSELEELLNLSREIYDDIEFIIKKEKSHFLLDGFRHDLKLEIQSIIKNLT